MLLACTCGFKMRTLYHYPLCAFSRIVRLYLNEAALPYEAVLERPWDRKHVFSEKHMISDVPTLEEKVGVVLEGWYAITEHLEQAQQSRRSHALLGKSPLGKAEIRKITSMFNEMFFADVTKFIVFEKIFKKHIDGKPPDSVLIRRGCSNVKVYFEYLAWLIDHRNWLAGNDFSIADISAAAHISCLDYVGSINWDSHPIVKEWYVRIKSRPTFREILNDRISDYQPSTHYSDLDF